MKFAAYHAAAHPEPHRVLGKLLRPYALGHVELLHACESNFIHGGELTWEDLGLSILICERTYEQGRELIWKIRSSPWFARRHVWKMFRWGKRLRQPNIAEACLALKQYIEAGSEAINIRYPEPLGDGGNEAPQHQLVKTHFLFHSCLSETQILNRPWGLALSEWMTHLALQGFVTALDDEPNEEQKRFEADASSVTEPIKAGTSLADAMKLMRDQMRKGRQAQAGQGGTPCDN